MRENINLSFCRICLETKATLPIFESISIYSKMCLVFGETIEDQDDYPKHICKPCNESLQEACDFIEKYEHSSKVLQDMLLTVVKEERLEDFGNFDVDLNAVQLDHCYAVYDPIKIELEDIIEPEARIETEDGTEPKDRIEHKDRIEPEDGTEPEIKPIKIVTVTSEPNSLNKEPITENDKATKSNKEGNINNNITHPKIKEYIVTKAKSRKKNSPELLTKELKSTNLHKIQELNKSLSSVKLNKMITDSILEGEFKWCGMEWRSTSSNSTEYNVKQTPIDKQQDKVRRKTQKETSVKNVKSLENLKAKKSQVNGMRLEEILKERMRLEAKFKEKRGVRKEKGIRKGRPDPVVCEHCGVTFGNAVRLKDHLLRVKTEATIKCPQCPHMVKFQPDLKRHMARRHKICDELMACSFCGKQFAYRFDMNIHMKHLHSETPVKRIPRSYPCDICGKVYRNRQSRIIHIRSVHTGERPEECTYCGKKFYCEVYLREHILTHTGERPIRCPICNQGFTTGANMKSHVHNNHRLSDFNESFLKTLRPAILKRMKP